MKLNPLLAVLCVFATCGCQSPTADRVPTADRSASDATRRTLAYIESLRHGDHPRMLSGQFLAFAPRANLDLVEKIHEQSGKYPAFVGVDYINFGSKHIDPSHANAVLIDYWRHGGLAEVNVHLMNPANPGQVGLRDKGVNLQDLLPGGRLRSQWTGELDAIAAGLRELQEAGVVVLWRPLHEMNGGWFWWGAKPKEDFVALWRDLFTYFTLEKGLHNLLWVYSPNSGPNTGDYYPGDAYVDIVGVDAYNDNVDAAHVLGTGALLATSKPFGFGEYGPHGASNPPGDYDYRRFLKGAFGEFPTAVFFMAWNEKWSPANNLHGGEFYNDERIVTRADLPASIFR